VEGLLVLTESHSIAQDPLQLQHLKIDRLSLGVKTEWRMA
jgi:hypothetical protein